MMLKPFRSPTPPDTLDDRIRQEQLRQAQHSYNLSFVVLLASAIFGFTSAGLLLHGRTTAGVVAATASLISTICQVNLKFSQDANERLKKQMSEREDESSSE